MKYSNNSIQKLQQEAKRIEFLFFWGHQPSKSGDITKSCLSQWWMSSFVEDGKTFHTAEHYMMAQKARLFDDYEVMDLIVENRNPKEVKALGRKVKNFNAEKWDANKYQIVLQGNTLKFSQNILLKDYLLGTDKRVIVEASPVDNIWGVGMAENNNKIYNSLNWKGPNLLGFALMEVRDLLTENN